MVFASVTIDHAHLLHTTSAATSMIADIASRTMTAVITDHTMVSLASIMATTHSSLMASIVEYPQVAQVEHTVVAQGTITTELMVADSPLHSTK